MSKTCWRPADIGRSTGTLLDLHRQLLKRARPTPLDALERTDQDLFDARPTSHELRPERPQSSQKSQLRVSQAAFPPRLKSPKLPLPLDPGPSLPAPDVKIEDRPQTASGKWTEMTVQHAGRQDGRRTAENFLLMMVQNRISLGTDRRSLDLEEPMILPADEPAQAQDTGSPGCHGNGVRSFVFQNAQRQLPTLKTSTISRDR